MDIEARLKELVEAYTSGQLGETEFEQRLNATVTPVMPAEDAQNNWHSAGSQDEGGMRVPSGRARLEDLQPDLEIGPTNNRFRLLFQLSDSKRVWLARELGQGAEERQEQPVFKVLKIFLPPESEAGVRDADRDEKALRLDVIGWRGYLARIKARVELAAKLNHPNIATVYGWRYGPDGWPIAEMEYIAPHTGQSLAQLLERKSPTGMTWQETLSLARPIASALDYAARQYRFSHQHLDVDTIFITYEGDVRLLSFGLVSEISEPLSVRLDMSGVVGELPLAKPVEAGADNVAFRRDVFALALLLYRMLAGCSAYQAQELNTGTLPRPSSLTDAAWQVLRRGLAYPNEICPTDAGAFIQELEAAQTAADTNQAQMRRWQRWLVAGFSVLGCVGVLLLLNTLVGHNAKLTDTPQQALTPEATVGDDRAPGGAVSNSGTKLFPQQDAEREVDQRAFEAAKRVNTLVAYRLYLQRCPACGYRNLAEVAIRQLEIQERVTDLKAQFEAQMKVMEQEEDSHRENRALATLEALAAINPSDPLLVSGRQRVVLNYIKWARASLQQNSIGEAKKWLQKARATQPDLSELAVLTKELENAEVVARSKRQDDEAFAAAQRVHTRKTYWAYLERCAAECGHRPEAEAALARLAPANPVIRDRLSDGVSGPEMVVIPAGNFQMGSPPDELGRYNDEQQVFFQIEKPFAIGRYEVMFYEYDHFATTTGRALPNDHGWGRGRRPVINVSWMDAKDYAEWLSKQTGYRYRLPTEMEWEYAARAGVAASRYWGADPNQGCAYANAADLTGKQTFPGWNVMNCHDGYTYTAPAGSYRNNDFGLYDMLGNVLEWTCSLYDKDNRVHAQGCEELAADRQFVIRGGSWNDEPRNVRSADRHRSRADFRDYFLGFRLIRELP